MTMDPGGLLQDYVIFPDGTRVNVEVADSARARERGLMFRTHLSDGEGMLFPFRVPGRHAFWMKNVRVLLDIVWLDEARRVIWIVESAPPCDCDPCPTYAPGTDASWVIELPGGFVRRHGLAPGAAVGITRRR